MLPNGIIMSRLVYLISEDYLMKSLQLVQNKAARIVAKEGRRTPIQTLLRQSGWLSVSQLWVFHSLETLYKVLLTQSPHYLYSKVKSESSRELNTELQVSGIYYQWKLRSLKMLKLLKSSWRDGFQKTFQLCKQVLAKLHQPFERKVLFFIYLTLSPMRGGASEAPLRIFANAQEPW